ncbi:MAG: iron transporter [Anaerolineales bacterium]|jgi:hypothetical protein
MPEKDQNMEKRKKENSDPKPVHPLPGNLEAEESFDKSALQDPQQQMVKQEPTSQNLEVETGREGEENDQELDSVEESPLGYVKVDTEDDQVEGGLLEEETPEDSITLGTNVEEVVEDIAEYTDDTEVIQDFEERQRTNAGSDQMLEELTEQHANTPDITSEDVDADWGRAQQVGEEAPGGTVSTPDQDVVEEIGEAVGITYDEDEPLDTYDKLRDRDRNRWELDPASADQYEELDEDRRPAMSDDEFIEEIPMKGAKPPMKVSDEAQRDELNMARGQGDQYARALNHMAQEVAYEGGEKPAGDYIVSYAVEEAEGMYHLRNGDLEWEEPEDENTHIEIAVRDGSDNRFIPALDVTLTVIDQNGEEIGQHRQPFLWHPWLYHYGRNWNIPGEGEYTLKIRIEAPPFPRHDRENGLRFVEPVEVEFTGVTLGMSGD